VDIATYRKLQDSEWVRSQRDRMAAGEVPHCPVDGCTGQLVPFDADEFAISAGEGLPRPGGVRCSACGARSRAVAF
jgi:hypothetical protein